MTQKKPISYVYGFHPVREILKARKRTVYAAYTTKPPSSAFQNIKRLIPKSTRIQYISRTALNRLADHNEHQGIVIATTAYMYIKRCFTPKQAPHVLMLDCIQDPRNLGAILRSAYCTNILHIILPRKHTADITPTALKASAGLAEHLQIYQPPSSKAGLQEIKNAGYTPYLATTDGMRATECSFPQASCLVIGNEATGISQQLLTKGKHITLPQKETDISYNASVAAGILLFLLADQTKRI